jgi:DNA-binding MarR family transcriptional regulator
LKNTQSTDNGGKMSEQVDKTERIYAYLVAEWTERSRIQSYREIARECEMALTTVVYHLDKLEGQGRIVREANKARSIRLTTEEQEADAITEQVYQFICDHIASGNVPTQAEIADGCYISRSSVRRYLSRLEGQGRIAVGSGIRAIHVLEY